MSTVRTGRPRKKPITDLDPEWVHVGYVLKNLRVRYGYSADKLAQEMGISASYLRQIESGEKFLPDERMAQICKLMPGPDRRRPLSPIAFRWSASVVATDDR